MIATTKKNTTTGIIVFQQYGSGENKIAGIRRYGRDMEIIQVVPVDRHLPAIIDNPEEYLLADFSADLVLSFLKHPDLVEHLALICKEKKIPMIASGGKTANALTPFTCCGLGRHKGLGAYGDQFGLPEFEVEMQENRIVRLEVRRGASCGATWEAARQVIGMEPDLATSTLAREVQYVCLADPSVFDPISGKSALHYAGEVHAAALTKAINKVAR